LANKNAIRGKQLTREYFNQRASIWDETIAEKNAAKLESMIHRLNIQPGSSILDVGTGTGVFIPFLLRKIGVKGQLVAMDIADKMLEISRAKNFNGNIEYLQADITMLPLTEKSFDNIICYSSFPHFYDKSKALAEMYRVLKSGGGLFICHTSSRAEINTIHSTLPVVQNDLIPDINEVYTMLSLAEFADIKIEDKTDSYLASAKKPI
jgi:ubiquinone/menaquinone biosynthesis C-methylase UbiE